MKPLLGQEILVSIRNIGIYGEGVGDFEGFTIFVEGALPEEVVSVRVHEVRKNFARGKILSFEKKSPDRIKPPCPVFGRCGGCQLQHLSYEKQLSVKRERVRDSLQRIGKLNVEVNPCIPSPNPFSYRNKIQLPVENGRYGLYAFNSHDLVEVDHCLIHCPLGEKVFKHVRQFEIPGLRHLLIKTAVNTSQALVIFVTEEEIAHATAEKILSSLPEIKGIVQNIPTQTGNVILGQTSRTLAGHPFIEDKICGLTFKVSPASFFQVNPPQAENLYLKTLEACALSGSETVLDAYCGVGTLSLILAPHAKHVLGVECVAEAIADAKENAQINHLDNVQFHTAQAEDFISTLSTLDVAILNPPRKGCDPHFLEKLAQLKPSRIAYISCDPATLARDLAYLNTRGYQVMLVQPFDMFPQTIHVETLVMMLKS